MSVRRLIAFLSLAAIVLLGARASLAAPTLAPLPNKYLYTIGPQPLPGAFSEPGAIAVAANGDIYLADTETARIQRFASDGAFLAAWGTRGDDDGQFHHPRRIAIAPDTSVYVTDDQTGTVQRFTANGQFLNRWGSLGSAAGQFGAQTRSDRAMDIAVGADGSVYVADTYNQRIQHFTAAGGFLGQWPVWYDWEKPARPLSVAVAPNGRVYVGVRSPDDGSRVHVVTYYSPSGDSLGVWGPFGAQAGALGGALDLTFGADDRVYVIDNGRIKVYTPDGAFITAWNTPHDYLDLAAAPDGTLYGVMVYYNDVTHLSAAGVAIDAWRSAAPTDSQIVSPFAVAVDVDNTLYVRSRDGYRIQRFDSAGRFLDQWPNLDPGGDHWQVYPGGMTIAPSGVVYIADDENSRIQMFSPTGTPLGQWGSYGAGDGEFNRPTDVAVAPDGTVYVTDGRNNRVQHFSATGQYLGQWGSHGDGWGQLDLPHGLAVSASGIVYVADTYNNWIQRFTADGQFIDQWPAGLPVDVAIGPDGAVYVVDVLQPRILRFTADGQAMGEWGGTGSGRQGFVQPYGVTVGPDGRVYVADTVNHRVQVFGPTSPPTWRAEYYANRWLAGPPSVITPTADIALDWGANAPDPALPADNFSARFTRNVPFDGGFYRFTLQAAGGARLWVDGRLLVDTWDGPTVAATRIANLGAGEHVVRLEYDDVGGAARVSLTWQPLDLPSRLFLPLAAARP